MMARTSKKTCMQKQLRTRLQGEAQSTMLTLYPTRKSQAVSQTRTKPQTAASAKLLHSWLRTGIDDEDRPFTNT